MNRYKITVLHTLVIFIVLLSLPLPSFASTRTAIVVGNNEGLNSEVTLQYAESDARKIAKVLVELGSFKASQVHVLLGKDPAALKRVLRATQDSGAPGDGDQLFFYYSGHGDGKTLHMSGQRVAIAELRAMLPSSSAGLSVVLIDSCQSGEVTRTKGAKRSAPFNINLIQDPNVEGSIIITSSSSDEVSQESDTLQGSFFTHYWVAGLYGQADENRDKLVTLEEAYRFAHYQTVDRTISSHAGVQHPSYRFALSGQGNIVLANLHGSTATIRINSRKGGRYFVLDPQNRLVLTELRTSAGQAQLNLPPGTYRIRKREKNRFLIHDVSLRAGESAELEDSDMRVVPYSKQTNKGGNALPFGVHYHGPLAKIGRRSPTIDEMSVGANYTLGYSLLRRHLLVRPRLRVLIAEVDELVTSASHHEYNFGASVGLVMSAGPFQLSTGLDGGLVLFHQRGQEVKIQGVSPSGVLPLGLEIGAFAELALPISDGVSLLGYGRGGLQIFSRQEQLDMSSLVEVGVGLQFMTDSYFF